MLNEERIRLMTKTAAYEEHEGKKNMVIGSYFRSDYLELNVIKTILSSTIAFILIVAMVLYYKFEIFLQDIYTMDLMQLGRSVLIYYVVFVSVCTIITYIVYSVRYSRAKKSLKHYYNNLKKLSSLYEKEGKRQ